MPVVASSILVGLVVFAARVWAALISSVAAVAVVILLTSVLFVATCVIESRPVSSVS